MQDKPTIERATPQGSALATLDRRSREIFKRIVDQYLETGEPLQVAGGFTIDGYAAPFVDGIDGDHGTVLGLSMPLLRVLLHEVGTQIVDLWTRPVP